MKKKKSIVISASIIIIAIIVAILGVVLLVSKSKWQEAMSTFGPLNIIATDDIGIVGDNHTVTSFVLTEEKDYFLLGDVTVSSGKVSCVITCDGEVIYENDFNNGNYAINTDVYKKKTGDIKVDIYGSDDVDGEYKIALYTRENLIKHFIRRVKEYI